MKFAGYFKRHGRRIGLSLLIMLPLLLNGYGVLNLDFIRVLENYVYDMKLKLTMPGYPDPRVVIVDIDEKSLQEQGHWPWPRNKVAKLVDLLFDHYQIDVLGFDILFAERDESSGLKSLEALAQTELSGNPSFNSTLNRLRPQLNYDQVFADSLKNRRVVLGYYFRSEREQGSSVGTLPKPVLARGSFDPAGISALPATAFAANLPELQTNAAGGGFFSFPLVDNDGKFRRIALLQEYQGSIYEVLGLAVARLHMQEPKIDFHYGFGAKGARALESLKISARQSIPVDADVAALIPFRGPKKSFSYISASDVLNGTVPPQTLRKAIVLIGSTAPGLMDLRTTPVGDVYPGVEMHANLIAGIIDDNIKERPDNSSDFEFWPLLLVGLLLACLLPSLKPMGATMLSLAVMAALLAGNVTAWQFNNFDLPLASILLLAVALFLFNMAYGYFVENHGKRLLTGLFGQYVPPELVDEMAKDPGAYSLEGESRELTVLFSDVRGFTTISEGLDPTQLTQLMNEYLTPMTHVIQKHRGTIDKYMGDAIMAFWGAPLHDPQHARYALLAGMEMLARLEALQDHFKAKGWPPIKAGVGLNTGAMTVGNMGSEFRLAYTVMGDAVNLGSRLEGLTKEYGVQIMVSEFTRAAVPDFVYRELDRVRVKGKDKPVGIFEPVCAQGEEPAGLLEELALYEVALRLYREQAWQQAAEQFAQLQTLHPQRYLYQVYAKRITYLRESPPGPDWDSAFTFTTK